MMNNMKMTVSFKNNWASDEGEPRDWIKEIQDEIKSLRMKVLTLMRCSQCW